MLGCFRLWLCIVIHGLMFLVVMVRCFRLGCDGAFRMVVMVVMASGWVVMVGSGWLYWFRCFRLGCDGGFRMVVLLLWSMV